jgi:sialidase-1
VVRASGGQIEFQDVWIGGTGGYHTYRIPALVTTPRGTLVAICEGRRYNHHDVGVIDLLVRRSASGGRTWSETQIIATAPGQTCGNPAPVVDRETGVIWLPFCKNPAFDAEGRRNKWRYDRSVWLTHSDDDGVTWAPPVEITPGAKAPDWTWYSTGPCHGIQLSSGRLLVSCTHRVRGSGLEDDVDRARYSHVIYSDDHGATWHVGGSVPQEGTNECAAVEVAGGAVYLTCRDQAKGGRRCAALSRDGGLSFQEVWPDEALIEPACEASIVNLPDAGGDLVVFCNPASRTRDTLTVRLSRDACRTWPVARVLEPGPAAYSDLAALPEDSIACLFERGQTIPYEGLTLARFDLQWLTAACAASGGQTGVRRP